MTMRCSVIALTIASASAVGCTARVPSPQPVPLDRVECARCRMLISSENGGGQIVSASDDPRFYDDIGCLAADWPAHATGAHAFVRVAGGRWSEAAAASYARPADALTPMGSALAAFASPEEARAADRGSRAMTFDEVIALAGARR